MADSWCGSVELCSIASKSYAFRDLVDLAIDGHESRLATTFAPATLERAYDALCDCEREGCPMHREAHDARGLLRRLLDEAEREDEAHDEPECACRGGCRSCLGVRGWL